MLVKEVMTSPVITVRPQMTLKEATQLLEKHRITAMPVVDGHGTLVGVLSEADIIQDAVLPDPRAHEMPVRIAAAPRATRVADVMSRYLLTLPPNADLTEAAELMTSSVVKSLPVVENGLVVGIISRVDIIRVLARSDESVAAEVDGLVHTAGEDWTVDVRDGVVTIEGPQTASERECAQVLAATVPGVVAVRVSAHPGS